MNHQYKDKHLQEVHELFLRLGLPHKVLKAGIFGSLRSAFTNGFRGSGRCVTISPQSESWVAYYAGRECGKRVFEIPDVVDVQENDISHIEDNGNGTFSFTTKQYGYQVTVRGSVLQFYDARGER